MKVVHVIPTAFDYFEDIRAAAFAMVGAEAALGVEVEAITLGYGPVGKEKGEGGEGEAEETGRRFANMVSAQELPQVLSGGDILHVHAPFFGGGHMLLNLLAATRIPMVMTFHRPVTTLDFFSFIILGYTRWYLPKFAAKAALLACRTPEAYAAAHLRFRAFQDKLVLLDATPLPPEVEEKLGVQFSGLSPKEKVALKYFLVYTSLLTT